MTDGLLLRNRATIAVATGGTQGLGLAIAKRLAQERARGIVLSGRNSEKGEGATECVRSAGADCLSVKADVRYHDWGLG
jgi:NAD(P)-dependent dehydrogenase (short-subunit alcohol dehydrogenase family)